MKQHHYKIILKWTGNTGSGTQNYRSYNRDHEVWVAGKQHTILGASDPSFRGDPSRYNPEELFLASISNCHMLWYLHLCSAHQIVVLEYLDQAQGIMEEDVAGSGRFTSVTLYPQVKIKDATMIEQANQLHAAANKMCFIANSCNFKIDHEPITTTQT